MLVAPEIGMGRPLELLILSESERVELGALAARRKTAQALALRARIVLLSGDGIANKDVAARLGVDPVTVGKWRRRFWKAVPADLDVHLVMDTYATHKAPLIRDWLVKRPRWPVHHTPTGATRPREVTGTDPYIAPEECVRGEVMPAADVFGLAVLVYELLTGALPFGQGTRADLFPQTSRAPSPSRTHRPAAPKRLDDLLLSCLARNPRDRPPLSALLLGLHDFIRAGRRMWPAGFTPAPASVEAVSPMRADERNAA